MLTQVGVPLLFIAVINFVEMNGISNLPNSSTAFEYVIPTEPSKNDSCIYNGTAILKESEILFGFGNQSCEKVYCQEPNKPVTVTGERVYCL
uniref:Putative secreted protein n=1 Tax=Amblyomma triste TaxID=251400 RepID=A0A023G654_AMBTT